MAAFEDKTVPHFGYFHAVSDGVVGWSNIRGSAGSAKHAARGQNDGGVCTCGNWAGCACFIMSLPYASGY